MSLASSLTPAQKDELLALIAECRALGAESYSLSPLYEACGITVDGAGNRYTDIPDNHSADLASWHPPFLD